MSIVKRLFPAKIQPVQAAVTAIEWIVAVCTLVGGAYLFTPLYEYSQSVNGKSSFSIALSHPISIGIWGAMLVLGAAFVIYGLLKNKPQYRSIGLFSIFLARFFQVLTTLLVSGFLPISWIYPFTIMLIVGVLWGLTRIEVNANGS
jgi:hypothetical protein